MKNKNRIFRIASLLLVLCFISTVMISGTFAKYTSEYSGSDTALVARWSLDVKDGENNVFALSPAPAASLDLFSHVYDKNINQFITIEEEGEGKDYYIIAPGVSGEFVLSVTNNSDVAAEVTFAFEADGAAVPMEYSLDENFGEGNIYSDLSGFANQLKIAKIAAAPLTGNPTPVTKTVYWRWPFYESDNQDDDDTALGKDSADPTINNGNRTEYTLTVTATATQLTPEKIYITVEDDILEAGKTLTAKIPTGWSATYQWEIAGTIDGTYDDISGEINSTYKLVAGDVGKYIRVVVTGDFGTVTTKPVGPVAAASQP